MKATRRRKVWTWTVRVEREITFLHEHRVRALTEEQAIERAKERVRQGDWFGGDVVNDWITRASASQAIPARRRPARGCPKGDR